MGNLRELPNIAEKLEAQLSDVGITTYAVSIAPAASSPNSLTPISLKIYF